jgi:hypothetical protein
MHSLFFGDDFKRTRLFGDYPCVSGVAAGAVARSGVSHEIPEFKISGDRVWRDGMRGANADVVIVEIIGFEWPLLEILNGVISDERLIALPYSR